MAGQEQRIERGKSKKLNRHGDHVASCLCCEHFEFEADSRRFFLNAMSGGRIQYGLSSRRG